MKTLTKIKSFVSSMLRVGHAQNGATRRAPVLRRTVLALVGATFLSPLVASAASGIYVDASLEIMGGASETAELEEVAPGHTGSKDIASDLAGKAYVEIKEAVQRVTLTFSNLVNIAAIQVAEGEVTNSVTITANLGTYDVKQGAPFTVIYTASTGYLFADGADTKSVENATGVSAATTLDVAQEAPTTQAEAKVSGKYYLTLAAALASSEWAEAELCKDVTLTNNLTIANGQAVSTVGHVLTINVGVTNTVQGGFVCKALVKDEVVNQGAFVIDGGVVATNGSDIVIHKSAGTFIKNADGSVLTFAGGNCTVTGAIEAFGVGEHGHKFILGDETAVITADQTKVPDANVELAAGLEAAYVKVYKDGAYRVRSNTCIVTVDGVATDVAYGASVSFTEPEIGIEGLTNIVAAGWSGSTNGVLVASDPATNVSFNVTDDSTINWLYETNYWFKAEVAEGSKGTIVATNITVQPNVALDVSGAWVPGLNKVQISATPDEHYHWSNWNFGSVPIENNPFKFTLTGPCTILTAVMPIDTFDVTIDGKVATNIAYGATYTATAPFVNVTNGWTNIVYTGWSGTTNGVAVAGDPATTVSFDVKEASAINWLYQTNYWYSISDFVVDGQSYAVASNSVDMMTTWSEMPLETFAKDGSMVGGYLRATDITNAAKTVRYVYKNRVEVQVNGSTKIFDTKPRIAYMVYADATPSTVVWSWQTNFWFEATSSEPGTSVTINGGAAGKDFLSAGTNLTVAITGDDLSSFQGWRDTISGEFVSTETTAQITLAKALKLEADFTPPVLVTLTPQTVDNATMTGVATNTAGRVATGDWVSLDAAPYSVWSNHLVQVTYTANAGYVFGDSLAESNVVFAATTDPAVVPEASLPVAVPAVAMIVSDDETTTNYYATLEKAIEAVPVPPGNETLYLIQDVVMDDLTITKSLMRFDLNGKTLTIPEDKTVTINAGFVVSNTSDPLTGGLVVNGKVQANGEVNLSKLKYGAGGLIAHAGGGISIANGGRIVFMDEWQNESPNELMVKTPGFMTAVNGAKAQMGDDGTIYTYTDGVFVAKDAVAKAECVTQIVGTETATNYVDTFQTVAAAFAAVKTNGTVTLLQTVTAMKETNLKIRETVTLDLTATGYAIATNGLVNGGVIKVYQKHLTVLGMYANVEGTLLAGEKIYDGSTMEYPAGTTITLTEETLASGNIVPTVKVNVPQGQWLGWLNGVGPYKQMFVTGNVKFGGAIEYSWWADHKTLLSVTGDVQILSNVTITNNAAMEVIGSVTVGEKTITLSALDATFANAGCTLEPNKQVVSGVAGYSVWRSAEGVYSLSQPTVTYSWQPTVGGTVVASNQVDGTTWTPLASGETVPYGDNSKIMFGATPVYNNAERYEFVSWTVCTNGLLWKTYGTPFCIPKANKANVTNYDAAASFQWKSNYTENVSVAGPVVWEVREGEDYSEATVSVTNGGTFSSKYAVSAAALTVFAGCTNVWDFTENGQPSFKAASVNNKGTLEIRIDSTLTNGVYTLLTVPPTGFSGVTSFRITDGTTAKDCSGSGGDVYVGAKRFKIALSATGMGAAAFVLTVEDGSFRITYDANGGAWSVGETTETIETYVLTGYQLPKENPVRKGGYAFVGWNTQLDGTGVAVTNGMPLIDSADHSIYATWRQGIAFDSTQYTVQEGRSVKVYVWGGSSEKAVQATVTYLKNTGSYSAAYVDGKKVSFPLTLSWAKGEISAKEILFQTTATSRADEDRFFTLQLGSKVGEDTLDAQDVCTVTILDNEEGVDADYVRALAWPAHGGTVSGGGTLANERSYRTLTATAKNGSMFVGWFKAQTNNAEAIDFDAPVDPYSTRNPKQIRVGYGTENEAGTYFAYFTDVLEVAEVVEPKPFNEEGKPVAGVAGVTYWDDVNCVYSTMVGVKFALPVVFTDASGKGRLTVSKLPNGLSYNAKTGAISGVPTKAGTYNAQFVASNAAGKHTVTYTFEVAEIPTVAVGTFAGVVNSARRQGQWKVYDATNCTGVGSVKFTAGKTGVLSAKVVRRLSGTRSFSVKGYDYIDENTLGIAMTNSYKEVFEAKLSLTNGWYDTAVEGSAFGGTKKGTLDYNEEGDGIFSAVRNAFSNTDKDPAAQQILAAFNGTYAETLYATNGVDEVGSVQYRVNAQGNVYVAARLARTYDGEKQVSARTFSGTVTAGFVYDEATDKGVVSTALRSSSYLWSSDVLLDYSTRDVWGWARYIRPNAADKSKVVDVDEAVGTPAY